MPTRRIPPRSKRAPNAVWHYFQPGFEEPITANSFDDLIKAIIDFRVLNEVDMGDPVKDVEDYYRNIRASLQGVGLRDISPEAKVRRDQRTLIDKVRTWSKLAKNHTFKNESKAVVAERSKICIACPSNLKADASVTPCAPCLGALNRAAVILNGNAEVDERIGVCSSTFQDNRVAIFMPKEQLARSLNAVNDTPLPCWLRNL